MAHQPAQIPLHITKELETAATYLIDHVSAQSGYQAGQVAKAARRWADAIGSKEYVWLGVAGAATPVGLGGILADLISGGYVDAIVTTGANAYHDLHKACMLPVRHGSHKVDDNKLREDGTTRIYTVRPGCCAVRDPTEPKNPQGNGRTQGTACFCAGTR